MSRPKISLIGGGQIGGVQAQLIAQSQLADVVLFDVVEGLPQGKALDINHALSGWGSTATVTGANDYADTAGSDLYIVTAGLPRKPAQIHSLLDPPYSVATTTPRPSQPCGKNSLAPYKTESVYRRYAIVSERDVVEGLERLGAFLGKDELGSGS